MIDFVPATKESAKARIVLDGPSGSGKTYTALAIACHLAHLDGGQPCVIDTEHGAASKYAGLNGWGFFRYNAQSFSPELLTEALGAASGRGFPVVVIDSWSHYWMGVDGMLEQVDKRTAASRSNSSYSSGWKDMAPIERRMIEAILSYPGHVVATLRVKTEYAMEKDDRGKTKPVKIGMKPQQRENFESEFDVAGSLDLENVLTITKTRVPMLRGAIIPAPGVELAVTIADWLAEGEETRGPLSYRRDALSDDATFESLRSLYDDVQLAGLANAPIVDGDGNPTVLGDLIKRRGRQLSPVKSAS